MNDSTTIAIPLTKGYTAFIDQIDADLSTLKWCAIVKGYSPYVVRNLSRAGGIPRKQEYLHRVILERMIGRSLETGEQVDHIDRDGLNNRRANLRLATGSQNVANQARRADNTSGYKGVQRRKDGKWVAHITIHGKMKHIGVFDTAERAYAAYCEYAQEVFGEFARFK